VTFDEPVRLSDGNVMSHIPFWNRNISRLVAAYPFRRVQTRLRAITSPWLVAQIQSGVWLRVSGVVEAEWGFLARKRKEEKTAQFVRSFLKPGMTFVDVGANIGYFTLLAAQLVGSQGRIVAYEPTPVVAARLRENILLNGFDQVIAVEAAVCEEVGTAHLHQSADDPEANSLFDETGHSLEVSVTSLDTDLKCRGIKKIDLLKIDAEGAETLVLRGATAFLDAPDPPVIIIEINPVTLAPAGSSVPEILDLLASHRYSFAELESFAYQGEMVANYVAHRLS
jgi:FkbM family methyltransferase